MEFNFSEYYGSVKGSELTDLFRKFFDAFSILQSSDFLSLSFAYYESATQANGLRYMSLADTGPPWPSPTRCGGLLEEHGLVHHPGIPQGVVL